MMKTTRKIAPLLTLGMTTVSLWTVAVTAANAHPPQSAASTVSRTGPAGSTATRQSTVATNGQGGYSAHSALTGPNGQTATRQQSGSYNAATGTYGRSGTTTGFNGKQSNFSSSTTATGNGYAHSSTHNGPNGNSTTQNRTIKVN